MITVALFYLTFLSTIFMAIRHSALYLFVLYQAYYFFNPKTKWWDDYVPDIRFSFYIVLTLLIVTIIKWPTLSENKLLKVPQFKFLYLFVALYGIASFYAIFPDSHAIAFDAILTATVVITVVYKLVKTPKDLDLIIYGYIGFATYLAYYINQIGRVSMGRFQGAGMVDSPDANGVAAALAPTIVLCLYYFWRSKTWKKKLLFTIAIAFIASSLVQVGSRGAFLGVATAVSLFLAYMYFSKTRTRNQRWTVIGLIIMGLIGTAVVTDDIFWERAKSIVADTKKDVTEQQTGATRVHFWTAAWDMSKDYPFGQGSRSFIYYSPRYIPPDINTGNSRNRAVHSTWFEVLTEAGYPGLIAFVLTMVMCIKTCTKAANKLKGSNLQDDYYKILAIKCAFIGFMVTMTFLNRARAEILYWLILYSACVYNVYFLKGTQVSDQLKTKNN
uniref:O-antigen ligase family protein n=1 Tax=Ningiella ruwaisensis TaxID=2364274 RepID=UPI00109EE381|nr:O-antigen ligase family protein [Ningiella ruwaisensis]